MPMLLPKKTKWRKPHRILPKDTTTKGNTVAFGQFALQSDDPVWMTNRQIESARIAITRKMNRQGKVWIRVFPHQARTKKPLEVRMGKGKGNPEGWHAVVHTGTILFEVAGVTESVAREALRLGMHKLPCRCKIVQNPDFDPRNLGKKAMEKSIYVKDFDKYFPKNTGEGK